MAALVPPGAPRPNESNSNQASPPPPNYYPNSQTNPGSLADNFNNMNLNRPPSMPNSFPRPPFGQSPPFPSSAPQPAGMPGAPPQFSRPGPPPASITRPNVTSSGPPSALPPNMAPMRPSGPPVGQPSPLVSRPPPPGVGGPGQPAFRPPSSTVPSSGFSSSSVTPPLSAPPLGARPNAAFPPSVSSPSIPPPSAQSGTLSNGPPAFVQSNFPGGPRFPPAVNAPQGPPPFVGPPPMAASVRAPFMHSVPGGSEFSAPPGPTGQPASPFQPASQGVSPPSGSPFGPPSWPMQPGQAPAPPPISGQLQPPRMFGMPPPPPNQSMTTISPAIGQTGSPAATQSKIDPNQIPRPVPNSSVILFDTRQNNQANLPPPSSSEFIVRDTGNCSPRFMRCTIGQIPCTADLLSTSAMQLALLVQPFALLHPSEEPIQVSFTDETPREYHCNLGPDGRRRDADERPELCRGTVEFVASKEYMVRDPMPAVYFFLIDVSMNAIQTGATAAACSAISQVISDLPEGPRTFVGIATFDTTIHFYNLKRALQQPLMLIVPDVQDVYTPLESDVIVQLSECRQHLELLLDSIPTMFQSNRTTESAFGAAIKAAFMAMKNTGGKILVFQSVLPSIGIGALSAREAEGRTNISSGDKEAHKLLQPADMSYKTMAIELAEYQVCVDVFLTTQNYIDIASISVIARTTGGQVYYYYPFSVLSDPAKLYNDLRWNITRPQGFEAVMRVRCSQGIQVQEYHGNFCKRIPTDVDLPGIDCDKTIMVTLKHDDKLQDGSECAFQCALLYTTVFGQRRIRVSTLSLPCTSMLNNLFRSADLDTQFACFLKQAANEVPSSPLLQIRERITNLCVNVLLSYRKYCATVSSSGQLILPEALKLLPLYTIALIKSTGLRTEGRIDDRSFWVNHVSSLPIPLAVPLVYPRMLAIHNLDTEDGDSTPGTPIPLSSEHVSEEGIYLLENGEDCLVYVGNLVDRDILQQLFGISSVDEIPAQFVLQQYNNPLSKKLNDLMNEIRRQRCSYLR
ncbi:protein transport protein Sec24-like [Cucumis melo var. makuwa]|uniref:Protein transport protein Sec24-like n=1 Tax=Cucumis melo var. makuwa TaxID=1194695 RepID=A0A5A7SMU3_CUCMM|nr:protein transport protein Sec24-like [Cucumis melo var. makuwa]